MRSRVWLVLFLVLWLPLQGFALPLMPFCQHGHQQEAGAVSDHCPHQAPDQGADDAGKHAQDCDGCSLCHLASASAPITDLPHQADAAPGADLPPYFGFYRSHIPERAQRPPLGPIS